MKENNTQEEIKDEICEEEAVKSEETADEAEIESDVKEEKGKVEMDSDRSPCFSLIVCG